MGFSNPRRTRGVGFLRHLSWVSRAIDRAHKAREREHEREREREREIMSEEMTTLYAHVGSYLYG